MSIAPFRRIEPGNEKEIEDFIRDHPEQLDEGLKVLPHKATATGPLDILAVDDEGVLVVIEVKKDEASTQLTQAIGYYDWVFENRAALAQYFPREGIDIGKEPRIILVAGNFSEDLLTQAKYTDVSVTLFTYVMIEIKSGERGFLFSIVEIPSPKGPPTQPPTIEMMANWVENPDVRKLLYDTIQRIKTMSGQEPYPVKWSVRFRAKTVFADLTAHKSHFNIWTTRGEKWTRTKIASNQDLSESLIEDLKSALKDAGGQVQHGA